VNVADAAEIHKQLMGMRNEFLKKPSFWIQSLFKDSVQQQGLLGIEL